MQTVAVFSAPTGGIVSINGRMAGEAGPDAPLILPVTPNGTLYVEFAPFARRFRPCAYRFSFREGRLSTDDDLDMCRILLWPGNVCEFSLLPPAAVPAESEFSSLDGRPVALLRGEASLLRVGQSALALPDGAQLPEKHASLGGMELYLGKWPEGEYAAAFASTDLAPIDAVIATHIELTDELRAETELGDIARHRRVDIYHPENGNLALSSSSLEGGDGVPDAPEAAAMAALESALLGLSDEPLAEGFDAVIPMRYAPPAAKNAVALVKKRSERVAEITPLYYTFENGRLTFSK